MNRRYAEKLLRGGPEGIRDWNQLRKDGDDIHDLSEIDLSGCDLSLPPDDWPRGPSSHPRGANLYQMFLYRAKFDSAILRGCDLGHAALQESSFANADLRWATLGGAYAVGGGGADFSNARLQNATLARVDFPQARFKAADMTETNLWAADMRQGDFTGAILDKAHGEAANLSGACLDHASLCETDLSNAILVGASLRAARLIDTRVHGVSAWDTDLEGAVQQGLLVSGYRYKTPTITVNSLEIAQFLYLLIKSEKIRTVIDVLTSKVVLLLGRFTPERKQFLHSVSSGLLDLGYCPVIFDFDCPESRDTHETVTLLARLAKFIIADITEPRSVPQELTAIVPALPSVPVQPVIQEGSAPWGMFDHIQRYPWVLALRRYGSGTDISSFVSDICESVGTAKARSQ